MKHQKGQALILIAFGLVALLALTALAIDGGNAFADRRHAQNAADTSALTAALARINNQNWSQAAFDRAATNGYDNNGVTNTVTVVSPPASGPYACASSPRTCNDYIQVTITSTVDTWFARIVGIEQVNNRVEAVARAKPWSPYFFGHAVVALSPGDGKSQAEMNIAGNVIVNVTGSGIFVNSADNCGLDSDGGTVISVPGITVVGTACDLPSGVSSTRGQPIPYPPMFPQYDNLCSRSNAVQISGDFPTSSTPANLPSNTIFCISGDFKVTNDKVKLNGTGVTFVVAGGVSIQGGELNLSSPSNLPLFYLPYAANKVNNNNYTVTINGNSNMILRGQFLAPASHCSVNGTNSTNPLNGQLICYTIDLGGTADTYVVYNDNDNADEPPQVELAQ